MSYCSGSKKAILRATFPNGEVAITSYNPPINYQLIQESEPPLAEWIIYYQWTMKRSSRNSFYYPSSNTDPILGVYQYSYRLEIGGWLEYVYFLFKDSSGNLIERRFTLDTSTGWAVVPNSFQITNIITQNEQPSTSTCRLEVSDTTGVIYSRTESECPTNIRVECGEDCPSNTHCECIHNGYKCCFDENGNRIKVIPI